MSQPTVASLGASADRSKFGGWKDGPRLEATGYFRTEKVNGKWALVDPEGYLYFALGLANVRFDHVVVDSQQGSRKRYRESVLPARAQSAVCSPGTWGRSSRPPG